jgi:CRISPR-associated protein Csd2
MMTPCACIAFRHEHELGNARADQLFRRVTVSLRPEVAEAQRPPRSFDDYELRVDDQGLPDGVSVEWWVEAPAPASA